MRDFPIGKLNPLPGRFFWEPIGLGIEVALAPFTLDEETIETSIFLSTVTLPTTNILTLSGQTFRFPTNPEPGYIDGSMYVEHAHHPVVFGQFSPTHKFENSANCAVRDLCRRDKTEPSY